MTKNCSNQKARLICLFNRKGPRFEMKPKSDSPSGYFALFDLFILPGRIAQTENSFFGKNAPKGYHNAPQETLLPRKAYPAYVCVFSTAGAPRTRERRNPFLSLLPVRCSKNPQPAPETPTARSGPRRAPWWDPGKFSQAPPACARGHGPGCRVLVERWGTFFARSAQDMNL